MSARRYSDDEVRRILALAAEAEEAAGAEAERPWTLGDIEQIAGEAGLARESVAAAAVALERQPLAGETGPYAGRYFGLPVAVTRAVPLARRLSDEDWNCLVAELRETFAAEGRVRVRDGRREWRVGNLRVTHEPAGDGALLQMRTRKGDAQLSLWLAVVLLATAAVAAVSATTGALGDAGGDPRTLAVAWVTGIMAVLVLLTGILRLPGWARTRAQQFEALAAFARRMG